MRKIKIESWKASLPIKDKDGNITKREEIEENLLMALNVLIGMKDQNTMPKGLDSFRIFNKIATAFDNADKTKILELEEREYIFLKDLIEKDVPSSWGLNSNLYKALNAFLEAKDS